MKSGLLVCQFSATAGVSAALLRYMQGKARIEHVDLVIPRAVALRYCNALQPVPLTGYGLLGARFSGGVQLRPANYDKFTRIVRKGCIVPDIDAAYRFAFAQIGKPYDKGAILDFILDRRRPFTPERPEWFCDEFAYTAFWQGGKLLLDCENPLNLTPEEMMLSPDLKIQQGA
jgi:hypothetical protein